jgi:HEAT repeat protein
LLADDQPLVRAGAAEALACDEVVDHADQLIAMLSDPNPAVHLSAQQALLRGRGAVVEVVARALGIPGDTTERALEIAPFLPDGRLLDALAAHAAAADRATRTLAARALSAQAEPAAGPILAALVADPAAPVRAEALAAVGATGRIDLAGPAGAALADHHWEVRRAAGLALARLGPIGIAVLRAHLHDPDPFAADKAKQCLDLLDTERSPSTALVRASA